jgi:hypothetical protein
LQSSLNGEHAAELNAGLNPGMVVVEEVLDPRKADVVAFDVVVVPVAISD